MNNKKNIIIIGAGEIGTNAAAKLVAQGHDVTVIEKDPAKLETLLNNLDVKTVLGNGCLPQNLEVAGAHNAHALLALSSSDEVNFVASQVAYSIFDVKVRMARVYHQEYLNHDYNNLFNDNDLPVDFILSPEKMVADKIVRSLEVPKSYDLIPLVGDELLLLGLKLTDQFAYVGEHIEDVSRHLTVEHNVMYLSRGFKNFIPSSKDILQKSDIVYFLIHKRDVDTLISELGEKNKKIKDILIVGGGSTGFFTAKQLEDKYNIKLIEKKSTQTDYLANNLLKTSVINADAMNFKNLENANVGQMDVVINLTDSDEINSLCSMYEKHAGVDVIYTLIKNSMLGNLTNNMRYSRLVTPRDITVSQINKFIRYSHIYILENIQNESAEVVEVQVPYSCGMHGKSIAEFNRLKIGKVGALINQKGIFFDSGLIINSGDRIVATVPKEHINQFYEYLAD